jgi:CubicO group peptidase (beta-lactamase class C family)
MPVRKIRLHQKQKPPNILMHIYKMQCSYGKQPGLAVVVVKNGQVVFNKAFGEKDMQTHAPFTTSTLSVCASTTKAMTAVCMGMLVDAGKIKWSDKVSDVYPELKLYDITPTAS